MLLKYYQTIYITNNENGIWATSRKNTDLLHLDDAFTSTQSDQRYIMSPISFSESNRYALFAILLSTIVTNCDVLGTYAYIS